MLRKAEYFLFDRELKWESQENKGREPGMQGTEDRRFGPPTPTMLVHGNELIHTYIFTVS